MTSDVFTRIAVGIGYFVAMLAGLCLMFASLCGMLSSIWLVLDSWKRLIQVMR